MATHMLFRDFLHPIRSVFLEMTDKLSMIVIPWIALGVIAALIFSIWSNKRRQTYIRRLPGPRGKFSLVQLLAS